MQNRIILDKKIADFYGKNFLESLIYGESQINVWFPGSGKTTITHDILSSKTIVKKAIGAISDSCLFVYYSGQTLSNNAMGVLNEIAYKLDVSSESINLIENIIEKCQKIVLKRGKDVVLVGDKIEHLPKSEQIILLSSISKIVSSNKRRIHSIINTNKLELFDLLLKKDCQISTILNRIKFMPVISGKILDEYIRVYSQNFGKNIPDGEINNIKIESGGILYLTKERLRDYPNRTMYDIKLKSTWDYLSLDYKNYYKKITVQNKELEKMNVAKLTLFTSNMHKLDTNIQELFYKKAKKKYVKLYNFFKNKKNKIITKDDIGNLIWNQTEDEPVSDWTIDQLISRFRKTLLKFNLDPESLETIKGKGYVWKV